MLLQECGVTYSKEPVDGMQEFVYNWLHLTDNKTGQSYIWCWRRADLHTILNYWNRDLSWKYWI